MANFELLDPKRSVVVVIDLQGKLVDMVHRPRLVIDATKRLLQIAGLFEVPVLLTEQYPKGIGPTIAEIREAFDALTTPKRAITKVAFGCCGEPSFVRALAELLPGREPSERQVILAGIEAHVCVYQTALQLLARGEQVQLCWECVSGRGEEYRRHALARLETLGVQITNHETVAFEWARTNEHPQFKSLNRVLREGQLDGER
jgi:nicotinamidase-related amidase